MKVLGLKDKNMCILTEEEIIKKAKDHIKWVEEVKIDYKKNRREYVVELFNKLQKEPMPYKLFRLNELFDFNLNFMGCEITEEQFFDRLGQLPPISFKYDIYEGDIVNECVTGNRYEHIFKFENKFYCVIMDLQKNELKGCEAQ